MPLETALSYAYLASFVLFSILRGTFALIWRKRGETSKQLESRASLYFRIGLIVLQAALMTFYGFRIMFGLFDWIDAGFVAIPTGVRIAALVLTVVSLAGLAWTHITLGRHFSDRLELQDAHTLVTTGPYRWVRHPLYSFLFLFFAASAVLSAHSWIAACSVLLIANIYLRINSEEAMLKAHFGSAFDDYARRTARLVPGLF